MCILTGEVEPSHLGSCSFWQKKRLTTYFLNACADICRQYEDFRYSEAADFKADQQSGKYDFNLGRIPVLYGPNNLVIGQSKAMERYLAKKFGFAGDTPEEEAMIDMLCEHLLDIYMVYSPLHFKKGKTPEEDADIAAAKKQFIEVELPERMKKLERTVPAIPHSVGNRINRFDIALANFVKDLFDDEDCKMLTDCPKLKAIVDFVWEAIKEWVAARPPTPW